MRVGPEEDNNCLVVVYVAYMDEFQHKNILFANFVEVTFVIPTEQMGDTSTSSLVANKNIITLPEYSSKTIIFTISHIAATQERD